MTVKRALVTGITGQDGSYLAEFLLEQGYQVIGMVRRSGIGDFQRIEHIRDELILVPGDLTDQACLVEIIDEHRPSEVYNLAAQSSVQTSWDQPVSTGEVNALGVTRLLYSIKLVDPDIRFYQSSSSEMFGKVQEVPQDEKTPFYPRSPYGVAKVYGHWITENFRESYGLYACSGICFNHESPRRGLAFVTRKIVRGVVRIKTGLENELRLGNIHAQRDWGYAPDFVRGMWLMLQQNEPEDFVLATGKTNTVQRFVELAFETVGLNWEDYVIEDSRYIRPADVEILVGNPSKARKKLGWQPTTNFEELVRIMVREEMKRLDSE